MKNTILLVEDDVHLQDGLTEVLTGESYSLDSAVTAKDADAKIKAQAYSLVILDVSLPDGNGFELCSHWREAGIQTPILFLTAKDEEYHIVRGLDAGGDDYITKPFRLLELLSRIRALIRRNRQTVYDHDGLNIDLEKFSVTKDGNPVCLTSTEFQLLSVLITNAGKVMDRNSLLQNIWDDAGMFIEDNTLSVHISRLRDKIGAQHIKTIRGIGYRWEDGE
jgi:DNA-binding response OmpR family regulator